MNWYYEVSIVANQVSDIKFFVDDVLFGVLYPHGLKLPQVPEYLRVLTFIMNTNGEINNGER